MKKLSFLILLMGTFSLANAQQDVEVIYIEEDVELDDMVEMPPQEEVPQIFMIVEEMPKFPGGEDALREFVKTNIQYPDSAYKAKLEDKTYVKFIVDETGKVTEPNVVRGKYAILNNEAMRVVSLLPDFTPR